MFEEHKLSHVELENVALELRVKKNYICGNDGSSKKPF